MNVTIDRSLDHVLVPLRAIADEKRLRILTLLASGERCVCELQDVLEVGQSLLSFHLKTLKEAGLVTDRRQGRWVYYSLNRQAVGELERFLGEMGTAEQPLVEAMCCESTGELSTPAGGGQT